METSSSTETQENSSPGKDFVSIPSTNTIDIFSDLTGGTAMLIPRRFMAQYFSQLPDGVSIQINGENCVIKKSENPTYLISPSKKMVSVVVPIYFEELIVDTLVERLTATMENVENYRYELIFVNDGSTDASLQKLLNLQSKNPNIKIIDFSRNFGHQSAITAGMNEAMGDAVVVIDGDLQDPPEVIPEMIEKWSEGFHVVYGVRSSREGETQFKLWTAKIFYRLLSHFSDVDIPVDAGDFRLMDRNVIDQLKSMPERSRYIRGLVNWVGFKHTPVSYRRDARFAGETKYTLSKMLRFAIDGLTSFSDKPLHLAGYMAVAFGLFSLVGVLWILLSYFFNRNHLTAGWASTMVVLFGLGAIQLFSISIIGQYIGRIYKETRARPNYIIKKLYW